MPDRDIWEERNEVLSEDKGEVAGGAILGFVYTSFIYFVKMILDGRMAEGSIEGIGIAAIALLSWLSRVFFASVVFIASYAAAGTVASIIFYYYEKSYILLYSFILGSLLGYLTSILEVSAFPRRKKDFKEEGEEKRS